MPFSPFQVARTAVPFDLCLGDMQSWARQTPRLPLGTDGKQPRERRQGLLSADHWGCLGTIAGSAWFLLIMWEIKAQFKQSCKP